MANNAYPKWTIGELGAQVAQALAANYDRPANGQVRGIPNSRTIRFYTSLGLIDRPVEMKGRTAFYGLRHLWQIVAIKRLQVQGLNLEQIQQRLLGITNANLQKIAQISYSETLPDRASPPADAEDSRRSRAFWSEIPASIPPAASENKQVANALDMTLLPLRGVKLNPKVTLILELLRELEDGDLEAIKNAATPLINLLIQRNLITGNET